MSKDPAFLFYSSDFLVGTYFMSNEEVGCYIKLMCCQHQQGRLSQEAIDKMCVGLVSNTAVVSKFKRDENGMYYNERLEEVINKRTNYCQSRSKNASRPNAKKKLQAEKPEEEPGVDSKVLTKPEVKKNKYGEFENVLLSDDEYEKLKNLFPDNYLSKIEALSGALSAYGKKYRNHYATILVWARNNGEYKAKTGEERVKAEKAQIEKERRKMQ